jgi:4-amino-4-deoxy-L-arabinose transferase-like glycosyltransferase
MALETWAWFFQLYTYVTVPFVTLFGLSETTVRLAGLLFNLAIIPLLFVFVLHLFKNPVAGLIACLFFALNPWSIHFSRIGVHLWFQKKC